MHGERGEERIKKEAALASLYDEYYGKISRYAFVRLGDRAEAEDVAGEVFLKALESLDSYQERGVPMQAWLFKIAHNLLMDHFRKSGKRRTVSIDTIQVAADTDMEAVAVTKIEFEKVTEALDRLTPDQRRVIELRFFSGLTSEETGWVLKKKSGAVREMQSAAVRRLRKLLSGELA